MNIVIAGDGEVGMHLAEALVRSNHNITIVDPHEELLKMMESHSDLMTITGDSTSTSVLQRANVKKADLVISVLHDEHINLLTGIIAKKLGAKKVIARVNTMENLTNSKAIITARKGRQYTAVVTSNYHILRAMIYAKRIALPCTGIGSRTAFYYWPGAMIREYAALVKYYFLLYLLGYLISGTFLFIPLFSYIF